MQRSDGMQGRESVLIDGLLRNGTDSLAPWRAHMREMTMARQAAERCRAQPGTHAERAGAEDAALALERGAAYHVELARIDGEHRIWMREHGVEVLERLTRRRSSSKNSTAEQ